MPINSIDNDDNVTIQDGDGSGLKANVVTRSDSKKAVCVDAFITSTPSPPVCDPQYAQFNDMNASTGGVARDTVISTSWTDLYSYTGSGVFFSFMVNFDNDSEPHIRLVFDNTYYPLFGSNGLYLKDLKDNAIYDIKDLDPGEVCGIGMHDNAVRWQPKYGITFSSSIKVQAYTDSGNKKFRAGLIGLYKVT